MVQHSQESREGDIRVRWVPRMGPGAKAFYVVVTGLMEARRQLNTLADYDLWLTAEGVAFQDAPSNDGSVELYRYGEWEEIDLDDLSEDFLMGLDADDVAGRREFFDVR